MRISAFSHENRSGRVRGIIQDITDQKAAERRLRDTEERFHLLARATNDGTYDWDMERGTLWWGDAHYTLFGYSRDETPTVDRWSERVHPDDRDRVWASARTAFDTVRSVVGGVPLSTC